MLPAGDMKVGTLDFLVQRNAAPVNIDTFEHLPIKQVGNAIVYLRDVAFVHRGGVPQTNMVLVRGKQAVLMEILKTGDASTLAVVAGIKKMLPGIEKTLPPGIKITPLNDASGVPQTDYPLVRKAVTLSFCHIARSSRTTIAIFVSNVITSTSVYAQQQERTPECFRLLAQLPRHVVVQLVHSGIQRFAMETLRHPRDDRDRGGVPAEVDDHHAGEGRRRERRRRIYTKTR